jgi:putative transposase
MEAKSKSPTSERSPRENGICARIRRRFRQTTDARHRLPVAPNLLAQNFTATAPNQTWVGAITYIWLEAREGQK